MRAQSQSEVLNLLAALLASEAKERERETWKIYLKNKKKTKENIKIFKKRKKKLKGKANKSAIFENIFFAMDWWIVFNFLLFLLLLDNLVTEK